VKNAIVVHLSPSQRINTKHAIVTLDWSQDFGAEEVLEFDDTKVIKELCEFAAEARRLPNLTVKVPTPMVQSIKRRIFYYRLWLGQAG